MPEDKPLILGHYAGIVPGQGGEEPNMRKILFMPDFPDAVFWDWSGEPGPITPEELKLSAETCSLVWEFYKRWSEIFFDKDYNKDTVSKIDYGLLDVHGMKVWKLLRMELSGRYEVVFHSHRFSENFEDPQELEELLRSGL